MSMACFAEVSIFGFSIYYLYRLIIDNKIITGSKEFYKDHQLFYIISIIGVICLILSFQVYWFTSFYDEHKYIAILIKILLAIFSVFNQLLIYDIEKEKLKLTKKKNDDEELNKKPLDKRLFFKIVNRLFLLDISIKIFWKK